MVSQQNVLAAVLRAGYLLVNARESTTDTIEGSIHDVIGEPHAVGLTRELAPRRAGNLGQQSLRLPGPHFRIFCQRAAPAACSLAWRDR